MSKYVVTSIKCYSYVLSTGGVPYHSTVLSTMPVLMSNISCRGDEKSLSECQYMKWGEPFVCKEGRFGAGVLCYNSTGTTHFILIIYKHNQVT